jgi:hypothetical protein
MSLIIASEATIFLLVFLVLLLTLLREIGILLDRVLSLELLEVFLHHIGTRRSINHLGVCVLCSRILFSTQMTNDILH